MPQPNPYAPPVADLDELPDATRQFQTASKGRRFGTLVLDYVLFIFSAGVFGFVYASLNGAPMEDKGFGPSLVSLALWFSYYVLFEGLWGRTPGKLLMGTRVVNLDGGAPSFKQVLLRTLARFVPFEPFSFLGRGRGWHDRWTDTRVVRTSPAPRRNDDDDDDDDDDESDV